VATNSARSRRGRSRADAVATVPRSRSIRPGRRSPSAARSSLKRSSASASVALTSSSGSPARVGSGVSSSDRRRRGTAAAAAVSRVSSYGWPVRSTTETCSASASAARSDRRSNGSSPRSTFDSHDLECPASPATTSRDSPRRSRAERTAAPIRVPVRSSMSEPRSPAGPRRRQPCGAVPCQRYPDGRARGRLVGGLRHPGPVWTGRANPAANRDEPTGADGSR
jgi:hypothetical protein